MVQLRGILWRKMQGMKKREKKKPEPKFKPREDIMKNKEEPKEIEVSMEEEEARDEEEQMREEEERIKEEKIKLYRFYDDLNRLKLKDMGLDINKSKIRCVVCKKWEDYTEERLLGLIKRNGIDIIWKFTCNKCRKTMLKERVPEEYVPEVIE